MKTKKLLTLAICVFLIVNTAACQKTPIKNDSSNSTENSIDITESNTDSGITNSEASVNSEISNNISGSKVSTVSGKNSSITTSKSSESSTFISDLKAKWFIGEKKSLTWYINYTGWQYNNAWETYPVLKEVTDITGVTPKIIVPTGDGQVKLQTMMASNSLPDLISLGPDDSMGTKMISQGYVHSYDSLISKYAPSFKNEIDPEVWKLSAFDDNKLYGIPCFYVKDVKDLGATTFNVRKDIWLSIGSPDMSTPQGYKNALIAFKNKYPKINNLNSIPMTLGNPYYRFIFEESFGVKTYYTNPQGDVKIRFEDPNYRNVVKYLNDLYNSKLMDPEVFTKQDGGLRQDLAAGRVFSYPCTFWDLDSTNSALNKQKDGSGFISVKPMAATSNISFPGQNKRGWMTTMISKKSLDPSTAVKFVRFMASKEGNLLVNFGHEGKDYSINGTNITRSKTVAQQMKDDPDKFSTSTGIFTFRLFSYPYFKEIQAITDPTRANNDSIAGQYVRDNSVYSYKIDPDPASPVGNVAKKVWNIYNAKWPIIIMSDSEQEAYSKLDNMISDMKKVPGYTTLEAYWTKQVKENIAKFGQIK